MIVRAGPPFGGMVTNKVVVLVFALEVFEISLLVDFTELVVPISTLLLMEMVAKIVDITFDVVDVITDAVVAVGAEIILDVSIEVAVVVGEVPRFDVLGVSNVAVVVIP
jgi:hypothetical protein